jgi:hypothetical protein
MANEKGGSGDGVITGFLEMGILVIILLVIVPHKATLTPVSAR